MTCHHQPPEIAPQKKYFKTKNDIVAYSFLNAAGVKENQKSTSSGLALLPSQGNRWVSSCWFSLSPCLLTCCLLLFQGIILILSLCSLSSIPAIPRRECTVLTDSLCVYIADVSRYQNVRTTALTVLLFLLNSSLLIFKVPRGAQISINAVIKA